MRPTLLLATAIALTSCATAVPSASQDASSMEKALVVQDVSQEYEFVKARCPSCTFLRQSLTFNDREVPYDVLTFVQPDGQQVKYYFNIAKFYGKF